MMVSPSMILIENTSPRRRAHYQMRHFTFAFHIMPLQMFLGQYRRFAGAYWVTLYLPRRQPLISMKLANYWVDGRDIISMINSIFTGIPLSMLYSRSLLPPQILKCLDATSYFRPPPYAILMRCRIKARQLKFATSLAMIASRVLPMAMIIMPFPLLCCAALPADAFDIKVLFTFVITTTTESSNLYASRLFCH